MVRPLGMIKVVELKDSFFKTACRALWIIRYSMIPDTFHFDVSHVIDSIPSTEESEKKDTECIYCNGKFPEDQHWKIWIQCFSCLLWAHLEDEDLVVQIPEASARVRKIPGIFERVCQLLHRWCQAYIATGGRNFKQFL
ncbi:hypothetical protein TNCV_2214051 [Trichonephila clavipes]|nr:hypothetical protein TNCV_2214051 [Trichonephila clavipes]